MSKTTLDNNVGKHVSKEVSELLQRDLVNQIKSNNVNVSELARKYNISRTTVGYYKKKLVGTVPVLERSKNFRALLIKKDGILVYNFNENIKNGENYKQLSLETVDGLNSCAYRIYEPHRILEVVLVDKKNNQQYKYVDYKTDRIKPYFFVIDLVNRYLIIDEFIYSLNASPDNTWESYKMNLLNNMSHMEYMQTVYRIR